MEVLKVKLFHILEAVIDDHIEAFRDKKIVDGCYLSGSTDVAIQKIINLFNVTSLPASEGALQTLLEECLNQFKFYDENVVPKNHDLDLIERLEKQIEQLKRGGK